MNHKILSTVVNKKRNRRTKDELNQLSTQIVDALTSDNPQSVRHIFYLMTNPRLNVPVEKTEKGYRQIQYLMTKLRRDGRVRYDWVTDATRRGFHVNTFSNGGDFVNHMAAQYRGDLWRLSDHYVEVWCESRSIAGVIENDCRDLAVSLYPAGGFASISLIYQASEYINADFDYHGKKVEIIYIGDYDPAGVLIDASIEKELLHHLNPGIELNFHRIGITEDQIEEFDLPTKPRKAGDKRASHVLETVEAEAMPVVELRRLLRDSIERYLPAGALHTTKVAEESEREGLKLLGLGLRGKNDKLINNACDLLLR